MPETLNQRQNQLLQSMSYENKYALSDLLKILSEKTSPATLRRDLTLLNKRGYLAKEGQRKGTRYRLTITGLLNTLYDPIAYYSQPIDTRGGRKDYFLSVFEKFPPHLFSEKDLKRLDQATEHYRKKRAASEVVAHKELERFVIELSWKSSKIEGNTYTLLDTERLLREGIPAEGHTPDETAMIINHKKAFSFILENIKEMRTNGITVPFIEKVHELLVADLKVKRGLRSGLVGIIGTKYKPLDNKYQIKEALEGLCTAVNRMEGVFTKAFAVLVGISYIQPFEDGNKRAARLLCNAVLF